jgi:hypothetical protein
VLPGAASQHVTGGLTMSHFDTRFVRDPNPTFESRSGRDSAARPIRGYREPLPLPVEPARPARSNVLRVLAILGGVGASLVLVGAKVLLMLVALGGASYGTRLELKGGSELYYTSAVTEAEARRLADYLNANFLKDNPITMQLTKHEGTYQLRVCVKDGVERDEKAVVAWQALGIILSHEVFGKAPVEIQICNRNMKTVRVLEPIGKASK